ncbi:MAG: hypothetical protein IKZ39_01600, partial [Lachnospiraceae bacterium]|nr:hypothetical protein [Lachnospiraceae bacterium]
DAAADSFLANGPMSGSIQCYDSDIHYDPVGHSEIIFTANLVGKIRLSGKSTKYVMFNDAHGLFAYFDVSASQAASNKMLAIIAKNAYKARGSTHWYMKKSGYTYLNTGSLVTGLGDDGTSIVSGLSGELTGLLDLDDDSNLFLSLLGGDEEGSSILSGGIMDKLTGLLDKKFNADGENGIISMITGLFGGDAANGGTATFSIDGIKEKLTQYITKGGPYADTVKKALEIVSTGKITIFDVTSGEEEDQKSIEITANPESTDDGQINLEPKSDGGWQVQLNRRITYEDEDGNEHVLEPGFIVTQDIQIPGLNGIPSFRTEFAVIDTAVVGLLDADEAIIDRLEATEAFISDLTGDTIKANTYIRTDLLYANTTNLGAMYCDNAYLQDDDGDVKANLGSCFSGGSIKAGPDAAAGLKDGEIRITLTRAHGVPGTDLNLDFDMASTKFYKDAVEAAHNTGGKTAYLTVTGGTTLDPGASATVNAYYVSYTGATGQTPSNTSERLITSTISARALNLRTPGAPVRPGKTPQTITPGNDPGGSPYDGLAQVVVEGDGDLDENNIK